MDAIKAKLVVDSVENYAHAEKPKLRPVYSSDPASENYSWSQATPSGNVELYITNPAALGFFKPGKQYVVTFTEAAE